MAILILIFLFIIFLIKVGSAGFVKELDLIGVGSEIFNNTKLNIEVHGAKYTKKPTENTIVITNGHVPKNFSYCILIKNNRFAKYIWPKVSLFKSDIKPETNMFNPPVIVEKNGPFNVFRDDFLPGGTKQRGLFRFLQDVVKKGIKTIVYAGPAQGIAQAAVGLVAKHFGLESHMFYSGRRSILSKRAEELGVIMHEIPGNLFECQRQATEWVNQHKDALLLPFGLNDEIFKNYLISALKAAVPEPEKVKHIWVVGGSGVLVNCLYHVFPTTYFHLIQVGKAIWPDMIRPERTQVIVYQKAFAESSNILPPYNSIDNYDAKVWDIAMRYGQPGDYIWNVAG